MVSIQLFIKICHVLYNILKTDEQTVKKTPDDGQRNCPKHVEFYSKNKFEKLVHLVGFIIRMTKGTKKEKFKHFTLT